MAEAAQPSGESQGAEVKVQQPKEKVLGHPRRSPCSVLKVSQLLLRAIDLHKGLTLATLKKELGHAGYEVCRKIGHQSSETSTPEVKGTLLRVSGSDAAGYFKVWKIPKPKRKVARPRAEEYRRVWKKSRPRPRARRRRYPRRKAAKRAQEIWRRCSRASAKAKRGRRRRRAWGPARRRARAEARTPREDSRPGSRDERRSSSKSREERKQEPEKPVKGAAQKPTLVKSDPAASGQGKMHSKTSSKFEGSRNAAGNL